MDVTPPMNIQCFPSALVGGATESLSPPSIDQNPPSPEPAPAPIPQSTPIKIGVSTTCPFTTNQKYRIESCTVMGQEMKKYLVGPMPAQEFLNDFFPIGELPDLDSVSLFNPGCYDRVVKAKKEKRAYKPFVS